MRAAVPFAALAALAACDAPTPPPPTEGQRLRSRVDEATKLYADCVLGEAETMPVGAAPLGALADRALRTCPGARAALVEQVRAFHRFGNPSRDDAYSRAVADASVKTLEDDLREQIVIAFGQRRARGAAGGARGGARGGAGGDAAGERPNGATPAGRET